MRIAVCDDDERDRQYLLSCLDRYDSLHQLTVEGFADAASFYNAHKIRHFDLAILDIEMPPPNGYDIAKKLVASDLHPPLILFVTNSLEYTVPGYGVAFRYLVKPVDMGVLASHLDAAIKEISSNHFVFSCEGRSIAVRLQDILFFEVKKHYVMIHTVDEIFTIRGTLQNIIERLPAGHFAAPHSSYLVNLSHVASISKTSVCLENHEEIAVSRRNFSAFTNRFYDFMGKT